MKQDKLLSILLPAASFLLPLFFMPFTTEYYESSKTIFLLILSVFLTGIWTLRVIKEKKLVLRRGYLTIPFILFISAVLVSLLLSQDRGVSLYGYFGRLINTFPFFAVLFLLFLSAIHTIGDPKLLKRVITGLILGIDILGMVVVLQHYGVLASLFPGGIEVLQNPSFNPMGSSLLVPFVFVLNIILSSYLFSSIKDKISLGIGILSLILSVFIFVFASPLSGQNWGFYLFLVIALAVLYVLNRGLVGAKKLFTLTLVISLVLSIIAANVNPFKRSLKLEDSPYVREVNLSQNFGWQIMGGTLSESPSRALFGSGPDTFVESFSKHKPLEYNSTSAWGIRYSRSSNQLFELLGNIGLIGTASFALIIYFALVLVKDGMKLKSPFDFEFNALAAVLISTSILGLLVVYNALIWFVLISALLGLVLLKRFKNAEGEDRVLSLKVFDSLSVENELIPKVFLVSVVIVATSLLVFFTRTYISDVYYRNSIKSSAEESMEGSLQNVANSIRFYKNKDYVHREAAIQSVISLQEESAKEESDTNVQQAFLNQVLRETEMMLSLGPNNVENWEAASNIYGSLINLTEGQYADHAVQALRSATTLDPYKPHLYENLGVLFARAEEYDAAKQQIEYAISLRPTYFSPYTSLAFMYELKKETENAIKSLEAAKSLLPEDSEIVSVIDQKIAELQSGKGDTDITEEIEEAQDSSELMPVDEEPVIPDTSEIVEE